RVKFEWHLAPHHPTHVHAGNSWQVAKKYEVRLSNERMRQSVAVGMALNRQTPHCQAVDELRVPGMVGELDLQAAIGGKVCCGAAVVQRNSPLLARSNLASLTSSRIKLKRSDNGRVDFLREAGIAAPVGRPNGLPFVGTQIERLSPFHAHYFVNL